MKEQLSLYHQAKEREAQQKEEERQRLEAEAKEEAALMRLLQGRGGGEGGEEEDAHIQKLILERRARLSLEKARERRRAKWEKHPDRKPEARRKIQREFLQGLAFEEALLLDEYDEEEEEEEEGEEEGERGWGRRRRTTQRSLPRFVHRDFDRLLQPTQASTVRSYTNEELDAKDTARLLSAAHDRPLPPGFSRESKGGEGGGW
jgi:U4/U6.U5 tri-snRNP-associated protein 1